MNTSEELNQISAEEFSLYENEVDETEQFEAAVLEFKAAHPELEL